MGGMLLAMVAVVLTGVWWPGVGPWLQRALARPPVVEPAPAAGAWMPAELDPWLASRQSVPPVGTWSVDLSGHLLPDERSRARLEWCWSRHAIHPPSPAPERCFEGLEDTGPEAQVAAERLWRQFHAWQAWVQEQDLDLMSPEHWAQQQQARRLMRRRLFEPAWAEALFGGDERRWGRAIDLADSSLQGEAAPAAGSAASAAGQRRERALAYARQISRDGLWTNDEKRGLLTRWVQDHLPASEQDSVLLQIDDVLANEPAAGEVMDLEAPPAAGRTPPPPKTPMSPAKPAKAWRPGTSRAQH